ncbi:MAG: FAD-dependent oxidoreductase [Candidatus Neomarinimicrobiota bacterium]
MKILETKVLVIGGGASGVCAAIQAARLGVSVILIEETTWLGGMLTAAGVSATDGNHRLPSGLWGEFRQRLYDYYGSASAVETGWVSNTLFEPRVGQQIFQEMCDAEPTLTVLKGYRIVSILKKSNHVIGAVFIDNQGENLRVLCQIIVEATEYGDALALAGCEYRVGRESRAETGERFAPELADEIIQDITYVAVLKDYGIGTDQTIPKPPNYNASAYNKSCQKSNENLHDPERMLNYGRLPNGKYMINWPFHGNDFYMNATEMNPNERFSALQRAKDFTLGFVYFIQTELGYKYLGLADDEFPTADRLALIPYNRESRRIIGMTRLKLEDIENIYQSPQGELYKSGIAVGDYPLDHHHHKCPKPANETYPQISSFTVPFGCLIPATIDGLLVAEKSISVTHYVNGCTRLQPCVMLIGQAAGAAAALCVRENVQPRDLAVRKLQQVLLDARAYLMPFSDVKSDDPAFQAIQRIGATGILKGESIHHDWVNELRFNPDDKVTEKEFIDAISLATDFPPKSIPNMSPEDFITKSQFAVFTKKMNWRLPELYSPPSQKWLTRRDFAVWLDAQFDPFNTIPV